MGKYTKIRNKIPKFQEPAGAIPGAADLVTQNAVYPTWVTTSEQRIQYLTLKTRGFSDEKIQERLQSSTPPASTTETTDDGSPEKDKSSASNIRKDIGAVIGAMGGKGSGGTAMSALGAAVANGGSNWGTFGAAAGTAAIDAIGQTALQGRNFNEASAAGDDFANAASDIAKQFGPWGQVAAMGIQALNVADKMGGKTVPGFQVPIKSSGFGNSLKESQDQSFRLSQTGMLDNALAKRNQQAQLALQAAQVDKDNSFQLEARMTSTEDVLKRNNMALAGGYGAETLGA